MAVRPIVDLATVKAALFPGQSSVRDAVITRIINAATDELQTYIAPRILIPDTGDYVEDHSGSLAVGERNSANLIYLKQYPILSITSVTENGVALVVGTGYDPNGALDVLRQDVRGTLMRRPGPAAPGLARDYVSAQSWTGGVQNIRVTYKGGFATMADVPPQLVQVCIELVKVLWDYEERATQTSASRAASGSTSWINDLSKRSLAVLDRFTPWGRPKTWAA